MFCSKCGKEIMDEAVVCVHCGCAVEKKTTSNIEDKINAGMMVVSILLPIVGLILWPVKHKETPKAAMAYGLAGIISWVICAIILGAIILGAGL